jgi:hypothetical protein
MKFNKKTLTLHDFILDIFNGDNIELQNELKKFFKIKKVKKEINNSNSLRRPKKSIDDICISYDPNNKHIDLIEKIKNKDIHIDIDKDKELKLDLNFLNKAKDKNYRKENSKGFDENEIEIETDLNNTNFISNNDISDCNIIQKNQTETENETQTKTEINNKNNCITIQEEEIKVELIFKGYMKYFRLLKFFFKSEYQPINLFLKEFNETTKTGIWSLICFKLLATLTVCAMLNGTGFKKNQSSSRVNFSLINFFIIKYN